MRTLYLECNMGAAGDMLMAALLELHNDPDDFMNRMNALNLPEVTISREIVDSCGIKGSHVSVKAFGVEEASEDVSLQAHHHEHHHDLKHEHNTIHCHTGMHEITHIIDALDIPAKVKQDALSVYRLIAEAESAAHGKEIDQVHFHEVGTMDAVADIVGVCLLMDELKPDQIIASPVNTGYGQVRCAHGILPVPTPATAYILKDVPVYAGTIESELCTPTGAALLKHFVNRFETMPIMRVQRIGYGMGKKKFKIANCVRAMLGDSDEKQDDVVELVCNLDDMTPEAVGFATELLMEKGALDVYTSSIYMKKNRPGIMLTCMCREEQREEMLTLLFKHTTTLGIREYTCHRYCLDRRIETRETQFGTVHVKKSSGYGICREKVEYDDIMQIARKRDLSIFEAKQNCEVQ